MSDERNDERNDELGLVDRDEAEIRALLEVAGRRPDVSPEELQDVRVAARAEWARFARKRASRHSFSRRWVPALVAAGLLVALSINWQALRSPRPEAEPVATVELRRGEVTISPSHGGEAARDRVAAGSWVETGSGEHAGRLALRLAGGGSLRFDVATRARLVSGERIELERGAVYFDSGSPRFAARPVEISTPLGVAREVGTQFAVRLGAGTADGIEVGVREGRVELTLSGGVQNARAGEWLVVRSDGGLSRREVARADPEWEWVADSTPAPEIEGRTLGSLLDWACRETGWELRFESGELEQDAKAILLHGTVEGLRPEQAIDVALAGAGLARRLEGRTLIVARVPAG